MQQYSTRNRTVSFLKRNGASSLSALLLGGALAANTLNAAPLATTPLQNSTNLVAAIAANDIVASNLVLVSQNASGIRISSGTFTNGTDAAQNIGLPWGVILSSGGVEDAPKISFDTDTGFGMLGDADIADLSSTLLSNCYDATTLQFDFTARGTLFNLNYVVGSKETVADEPVAVFLKDLTAGDVNYTNIAVIPSTTTPVSAASLTANASYYIGNLGLTYDTRYVTLSTVLSASAPLVAGHVYRAKIGTADIADDTYDTAIFLEGGMLTSMASDAPAIDTQPAAVGTGTGSTANFSVVAVGAPKLYYQWRKDGSDISNQTNSLLTITNLATGDSGDYTVVITNSFGSITSQVAQLTVVAGAPGIVTQPQPLTLGVGDDANFSVTATNTPLYYQWRFGGANLLNATNSSLDITNLVVTNTGDYTVVITNVLGSITSAVAHLTVTSTAPFIVTQPQAATVTEGDTANFSVTVTGKTPLVFDWRKGGSTLKLATNDNTLALTNLVVANAGDITVVITNAYGSITSAVAHLTVNSGAPHITQSPQSASVLLGGSTLLSVTATGVAPLTYYWLKGGVLNTSGGSSTLLVNGALASAGWYSVIVSNIYGTDTSSSAYVSILSAPYITTQPQGVDTVVGGKATFSVAAGGVGSLYYQWRWNGSEIESANSSSLTLNNLIQANSGNIDVVVTNSYGSVTSQVARLNVATYTTWGDNRYGQASSASSSASPIAAALGWYHNVALYGDGTVRTWGANFWGQTNTPANLNNVVAVSAGAYHSIALKSDGTVVGWGYNYYGQATPPLSLTGVKAIAAGSYHSLALLTNGTVVAWGNDSLNQCKVPGTLGVVKGIAAGAYHNLVILQDGTVTGWGDNRYLQLTPPTGLSGVAKLACGNSHTIALLTNGTVVSWGHNQWLQTEVPEGLNDVKDIAAGGDHSIVIMQVP